MPTSINNMYWNAMLAGYAYQDGMTNTQQLANIVKSSFDSNPTGEYHDPNGFDVLFLEKTSTPDASTASLPSVTIAFRGTEALEDYASDAIGITTGVVENQIVSMYNYLLKVFASTGSTVNQYTMTDTTEAPPDGIRYTSTVIHSSEPDVADVTVYHYLKVTSTASGLGLVPQGATVNFTGHSLGGHLAVAASRLFPNRTNEVYSYNGLGFQSLALANGSVDNFFSYFQGASSSFTPSKIHDITADGWPRGASNRTLFPMPPGCDSVSIPIERAGVASTFGHSIDNLEESLSVYKLLSSLDPSLSMDQMRSIILSATYNADGKLEATVDALRAAAKGGAVTATAADRQSLLFAISNDLLLKSLPSSGLSIISIASNTSSQLASMAATDSAVFLALQRLSPIGLRGYTPPIGSSDAAALALWEQDRAGTLEGQNFTAEYLADKAKMLSGILALAKNDLNPNTDAASSTDYHDRSTGKKLGACLEKINPQVTFGTSATDVLTGSSKVDHLYGGAGDDILNGGAGDDYLEGGMGVDQIDGGDGQDTLVGLDDGTVDGLEGGQGFDTYYAGANDIIYDEDGVGAVYFGKEKIRLTGGSRPDDTTDIYTSADGRLTYKELSAGKILVTLDGEQSITVQGPGQSFLQSVLGGVSGLPGMGITLRTIDEEKESRKGTGIGGGASSQGDYGNAGNATTPRRDPLLLDLDGDGIETTAVSSTGVHFDLDANGFSEAAGWGAPDDGILARDLNDNGIIDDGREIFGDRTLLKNGTIATNGFQALTDLDDNADGKVDSSDAAFSSLRVWRDVNNDGVTDTGELVTLESLSITSISTASTTVNVTDGAGNTLGSSGTYLKNDGTTGQVGNFTLTRDPLQSYVTNPVDVPDEFLNLPNVSGSGNVADLYQAMAKDSTGHIKQLVEEFIHQTTPEARRAKVEQLIMAWAGTESVLPSARSSWGCSFDARKLGALEQFQAKPFKNVVGTSDPVPGALPNLNAAWDKLVSSVSAVLNMRTHLCDDFSSIYEKTAGDGTKYWDLSAVVDKIKASYAESTGRGDAHLSEFVRTAATLGLVEQSNYAEFTKELRTQSDAALFYLTVLDKQRVTFSEGASYSGGGDLDAAVIGNNVDDYWMYASGTTYAMYGGDGNDKLIANRSIVLLDGGSGDDTLCGSTYSQHAM